MALGFGLNPLGNDAQLEGLGHVDDGFHNCGVAVICGRLEVVESNVLSGEYIFIISPREGSG
jgi:hypothetical protein